MAIGSLGRNKLFGIPYITSLGRYINHCERNNSANLILQLNQYGAYQFFKCIYLLINLFLIMVDMKLKQVNL